MNKKRRQRNIGLGFLLGGTFLLGCSENLLQTILKDRYLLTLQQQEQQQQEQISSQQPQQHLSSQQPQRLVHAMPVEGELQNGNNLNSTRTSTTGKLSLLSSSSSSSSGTPPPQPLPLCTREQIRRGQWYPIHLENPPFVTQDQIGKKKNFLCKGVAIGLSSKQQQLPQHKFNEGISVTGGWNTWEWKPNDSIHGKEEGCQFTQWDTSEFCHLMKNQTIVLMGDSLTQEHYLHLAHALGLPITHKGYVSGNACNGTVKVVHRRADYLEPYKLREELQNNNPSIVVLNRGAHYVNDTELLNDIEQYITDLKEWQQNCTAERRQCMVIWRTTVPGHGTCQRYHKPTTTNLKEMEDLLQKTPQGRPGSRFHWGDFQHQNQLVEQAFQQSSLQHFRILDAYEINMLRPDAHRAGNDCIHSCLGSKQLVYSQILLHYWKLMIMALQKEQQHQRRNDVSSTQKLYTNVF